MRALRTIALVLAALSATGAHARADGHTAQILADGHKSFTQRQRNMEAADVILLKTYILADDETGRATIDTLVARAKAGAKVYVQYDVKGTLFGFKKLLRVFSGRESAVPPHLQPLVDAGVTLIPVNRPRLNALFFGSDHDKLLVTWRRGESARLITGGMNIGDDYSSGGRRDAKRTGFRDTDIEITGPEVEKAVGIFAHATSPAMAPGLGTVVAELARDAKTYLPAHGQNADVTLHYNDAKQVKNARTIERLYVDRIRETPAGETITISNGYFMPTRRVSNAMAAAAQRGVKLHFVVNGLDAPESEARTVALATRHAVRQLLRHAPDGAITLTEWAGNAERNEAGLHQKVAIFGKDGPVIVGSSNLDFLSLERNSELVVESRDHRVRQQLTGLMNRALREGQSRVVTRDMLRRDSFATRAKGWMVHKLLGRRLLGRRL